MKRCLVLFVATVWMGVCVAVTSAQPRFLVQPQSVNAIDGSTVMFTCAATGTGNIQYRVNGLSAQLSSVQEDGFNQLPYRIEDITEDMLTRRLSVTVQSIFNNTQIMCEAVGGNGELDVNSDMAEMQVQGPLSSVGNISVPCIESETCVDSSYTCIETTTFTISWNPPFTLPDTNITGYNVSFIPRNSSIEPIIAFTSDTNYTVAASICDIREITVSAFNEMDGEIARFTDLPDIPDDDPDNDELVITTVGGILLIIMGVLIVGTFLFILISSTGVYLKVRDWKKKSEVLKRKIDEIKNNKMKDNPLISGKVETDDTTEL